jgi:hypothetical protein
VSRIGIAITSLSLGVMWWLARAKREAAQALGSRALGADAFQTTACFWLSLFALSGIALNAGSASPIGVGGRGERGRRRRDHEQIGKSQHDGFLLSTSR